MMTGRRICAVRDTIPSYRRGLMRDLSEAGYEAAEPEDVLDWLSQFRTAEDARNCHLAILHSMREDDDVELLRTLRARAPQVCTLALLLEQSSEHYATVLSAGASGAVSYGAPPAEIIDALAAAWSGAVRLPQAVVVEFARKVAQARPIPLDDKSIRRLHGLAAGRSIAELARAEHASKREMHRRLHALYRHLGVENRCQAIATAARHGLLPGPERGQPSVEVRVEDFHATRELRQQPR